MAHMHHNCNTNCKSSNPSTQQTLDEFDFERGIWSAVLNKDMEALEKHIQNGHTEDIDNSGYTALHYAARNGHLNIFKRLVSAGANVNAQTNGGATALHRAAMQGHNEIISILLSLSPSKKINPNIVDSDGQTILHRAAQNGHLSTVNLILTANLAHLKVVKDIHGRTPFDVIPAGDQYNTLREVLSPSTL